MAEHVCGRSALVHMCGWARHSTWRRAQTFGPSQDATLASGGVGLRTLRTAQLLPETARAASAGIGWRTKAAWSFIRLVPSARSQVSFYLRRNVPSRRIGEFWCSEVFGTRTVDLEKAVFCLTGSSPNERVTSVHVQVKPPSRFLGSFAEGGSFVTPLSTVPVCGRVGGLGWL